MKLTTPVDPDLAGRARFPFTLPGVLLIVAGYALAHALTRLLASGNLGEDDPLDNLLIQTLATGYNAHTGPLYDWLLWALQQLFGTGIHAFLALKYTLLVGMSGCIFLITRRITGSVLWAFIAVESMATVYQIFWRFHEGFTHRVGAMVLVIATFWAFLRLIDHGNWRNYLLFAVLAGLGLLSEHTYAFFLLALLAAASLQPGLRRRLFAAPTLATLPLIALIVSPYLQWLLADQQQVNALLAIFSPVTPVHSLASLWASLRDAISFPFLVLAPYIVIVPLVFPAIFKSQRKPTTPRPDPATAYDFSLLLTHLLGIEFAGLIISNLLYARSGYAVHSILPLFIIAIVWLTERVRQTAPSIFRVKVFMLVLLGFTVTAYAVRWGNLYVEEPFCSRCRWGIPYADLADELRRQGFREGTLITDDERTSGNLRRFFPDTHFVLPNGTATAPETARQRSGQLAIVWSTSETHPKMPPALQKHLHDPNTVAPVKLIHSPWQHLWRTPGYRYSTWAAVVVATPAPDKK